MLSTYDPKEIIVSVNGQIITGFSEDVVTVSRAEDSVRDEVGADGEVVRILINDRRGQFSISLLPTSAANAIFSALQNADEITGGSVFPVLIQDNRGNDLHVAAEAWISKPPDAVYNKTAAPRVWNIRAADLRMVHGGHDAGAA